ncbi:hypothetical protein [Ruegeria profundi]|uniref:hypothetical protein n=1 Tax=Ruegeria profundi TaxID=1685378 RepID=UPI003C7A0734
MVTWASGSNIVINDFDPTSDPIFFVWIGADALEITEASGSVVLAVPSKNQTIMLSSVSLYMLDGADIHAQDATARDELASLIDSNLGGRDVPETLSYQIDLNCLSGADVRQ